jgi:hypothetical protein
MLNKSAIAFSFALALSAATSAFAASGQSTAGYAYAPQSAQAGPLDAFARASIDLLRAPGVIEDGRVIGNDPDPNVRRQLERDYYYLVH